MRVVRNEQEMKCVERERALVGIYLDRAYSYEKISWLFAAREAFDLHARDAWHLLIPANQGYGVDAWVRAEEYDTVLAAGLIDKLKIEFSALPCIVFRAIGDEFYYLKLGGKGRDQFIEEVGRIAELARDYHDSGPEDPEEFRKYINSQTANHLRRRKILSATRSAIPVLGTLMGVVVDVKELI